MDKDNNATYLSQNLRFLRKQRKLSQEEFAHRVGLNRGNIASYENGSAEPRICNLIKIATLFGVSIIDLTQCDLRNRSTLSLNGHPAGFALKGNGELNKIKQFAHKAQEIENVFHSLHTCCTFKTKSLEEIPKDMQIMLVHFEQLHEAAQALLGHHKELIEFVQCRNGA